MKKTININLGGFPFIIDEDAYNMLQDYLDTIRYAFDTGDDAGEIAADIESRIAELLMEKEGGKVRIVTISEISDVIERIGKPEEIFEINEKTKFDSASQTPLEEEIDLKETVSPPPFNQYGNNPGQRQIRKRLFRDPQNVLLGGVCSGLAAYLNLDPTLVRLITVVLFFLSGTTVAIAYVIMWIVVPEAKTPFQRMQMKGEDTTVENIGKTVTENFYDIAGSQNELNEGYRERGLLYKTFSVFVKCVVLFCILILFLLLIVCIVGFFSSGIALVGVGMFGDIFNFKASGGGVLMFHLLMASIGAIIVLGVPLYLLYKMIFRKKETLENNPNRSSLLILWLAGIALCAVFTVKTVRTAEKINKEDIGFTIENLEDIDIDEDQDNVEINTEGIVIKNKNGKTVSITRKGVYVEKKDSAENKEKEEVGDKTVNNPDSLEKKNDKLTYNSNFIDYEFNFCMNMAEEIINRFCLQIF